MTELNEQQISEIAERLADRHLGVWSGGEGLHISAAQRICFEMYADWAAASAGIPSVFREEAEKEIEVLNAQVEAAENEYIMLSIAAQKAKLVWGYEKEYRERPAPYARRGGGFGNLSGLKISLSRKQYWEDKPPNELPSRSLIIFGNLVRIGFLKEVFLKEEQPEAAPAAIGEELERVVRAALEKRELLGADGKFTGDTTHVKALFVVLRQRGCLPKKSKIRAARTLSALFASEFGFEFAPRTVSTAEDEKNEGQPREETLFLKAIPPRK